MISALFFCYTLLIPSLLLADWPQDTLANFSTREKIGQLFMVATLSDHSSGINDALCSRTPYKMDQEYIEHLMREYHIGGLIFLGLGTPEQHVSYVNHYQALSKVPLIIGMDFEWGLSMRLLDTVKYPRNGALSCIKDEHLMYDLGKEIARQMKHIGAHINFSPVVDVNNNPNNIVIKDRSFGADKECVARLGLLMMHGLQDSGIIACAKHFPGHGDTDVDTHYDCARLNHTRARLDELEFFPFKKLIAEGVRSVMVAHLEIPALDATPHLPASLSNAITTRLLQNELGFKGVVITDGLGMQGVMKHHLPGELECKALLAGADILLCPLDVPRAVELIEQAIADGRLTMETLDAHVLKILRAKEWSGAHQWTPITYDQAQLHTEYAYALQKKLTEQIDCFTLQIRP